LLADLLQSQLFLAAGGDYEQQTQRGAAQQVFVMINGWNCSEIPSHQFVRCFHRVAASVAGIFDGRRLLQTRLMRANGLLATSSLKYIQFTTHPEFITRFHHEYQIPNNSSLTLTV
jgi:hypothetical protein